MCEAVSQTIRQEQNMTSYQMVQYSQDMADVIRQAVAAHPDHFSQFVLVTIEFHFAVMNNSSRVCSVTQEQSTRYLLNTIREHTRQSDLAWLKDTTCYFLLAGASPQGGDIVQKRLWKALQESIQIIQENSLALPCSMTIGHSAYPEPSATLEQCLNDALIPCKMQSSDDNDTAKAFPSTDAELSSTNADLASTDAELSIIARQFGVPYLPFLPRTFSNKVRRLIRPELAQELHCFPLGCARNTLTVAMSNPQDNQILARLQQETGMRIFPVFIHPDELQNALEHITR